jgi:hypothetical protein
LFVPNLKNTTPSWSNRGKFRERFYQETHLQFGEGVDQHVLQVAETLEKQSRILHKMIYEPILGSLQQDEKTISVDIGRALEAELDDQGWKTLFELLLVRRMGVPRPSVKSIREFVNKLVRNQGKAFSFRFREGLIGQVFQTSLQLEIKDEH